MNTQTTTRRELILDISEINETKNPFFIAQKLMVALRDGKINIKDYELLSNELFLECKRNNIETSCEICSLF